MSFQKGRKGSSTINDSVLDRVAGFGAGGELGMKSGSGVPVGIG